MAHSDQTVTEEESSAATTGYKRSLSAVGGDNNLLPAELETTVDDEKVELRGTPSTGTADVIMANASGARSSILPYPRAVDCREDLVAVWANSVMKECDELVIDVIDSRPSSLLATAATLVPEEWAPTTMTRHGATLSHADHDAERQAKTLMVTRTTEVENSDARPGDFRRIAAGPKPDKRVCLHFYYLMSLLMVVY